MADRDPNRPQPPPVSHFSHIRQLLDRDCNYTPYYITAEEEERFPGHATDNLSSNHIFPPEESPDPEDGSPLSDPIMDARKGGEASVQPTEGQGRGSKDRGSMSDADRVACDEKEFSSAPPDALSPAQKRQWLELFERLFSGAKTAEDPKNMRERGELRKLQRLADLASGKQE